MSIKKKLLLIVGLILLLGITIYGIYTTVIIPRMIAEKVRATHPLLVSYTKALEQITTHLQSDSTATDAAALQRDGEKGKKLLQQAETSRKKIDSQIQTLTMPQLTGYKQTITTYLEKAKTIESIEKESSTLSLAYVPILRRYETVSETVIAANTTVTSDPTTYQKNITLALEQEETILADLQKIRSKDDLQQIHEAFIAILEAEVSLLKQLQETVVKKDEKTITAIIKAYTNEREKRTEALTTTTTRMKMYVKMLATEQKKLLLEEQKAYQTLKTTYKF